MFEVSFAEAVRYGPLGLFGGSVAWDALRRLVCTEWHDIVDLSDSLTLVASVLRLGRAGCFNRLTRLLSRVSVHDGFGMRAAGVVSCLGMHEVIHMLWKSAGVAAGLLHLQLAAAGARALVKSRLLDAHQRCPG